MGVQTIPDRSNGQTIDETWFDVISQVLSDTLVGRSAGVAGDEVGNLGTALLRWGSVYAENFAMTREVGGYSVSHRAPLSLVAAYNVTWPAGLPGSNAIMQMDSSGNLINSLAPDEGTITAGSQQLRVKVGGIQTTHLADGSVTQGKRAALGQQISSSSGSFTTVNAFLTSVTNLDVTITTTGRPVMLMLIGGSTANAYIGVQATSNAGQARWAFLRDITQLNKCELSTGGSTNNDLLLPPSVVYHIDTPAAGTYEYQLQIESPLGESVFVENCKLVAFEL